LHLGKKKKKKNEGKRRPDTRERMGTGDRTSNLREGEKERTLPSPEKKKKLSWYGRVTCFALNFPERHHVWFSLSGGGKKAKKNPRKEGEEAQGGILLLPEGDSFFGKKREECSWGGGAGFHVLSKGRMESLIGIVKKKKTVPGGQNLSTTEKGKETRCHSESFGAGKKRFARSWRRKKMPVYSPFLSRGGGRENVKSWRKRGSSFSLPS